MTTNSTKYFCNRGAVSARLNLVDASLSVEYRYDGEHGKYYFGARYFDPFFGMWMSPDPAAVFFREVYAPLKWRDFIEKDILQRLNGESVLLKHSFRASAQFANPYTYGGDPINYIDPTGLWAIGLGLVVGWDNKSGWSFGVGIAADFGKVGANFSYTFNQDGSKSLNLGVNANIPILTPWVYLEINMGLGFSMNSYSGSTLSTHGGLCVGYATACGGIENGGSLYWDRGGSFMGATVYAGVYASLGYGMARVSAGYEAGLFGMEGRGLYSGASAGVKGASLYASWAENGGFDYGGQAKASYKMINNGPKEKYVGFEVGIFDFLYDHDARNENQPNFNSIEEYEKYASDNDMLVGQYSKLQSKAHNPEKNVKMWMAKSKPISIFGILLTIPSIEGVFNKKTGKTDPGSASYNYGNNWITHGLLDVLSWLVMDEWFPNP